MREGKERQVTKVSKQTETRAKSSEKDRGERWDRMDVHTVPGGLGDVYTILVMLLKDPNYFYRYYPPARMLRACLIAPNLLYRVWLLHESSPAVHA